MHALTCAKLLNPKQGGQILLASGKTGLLVCQCRLHGLLSRKALRLKLGGLILDVGLLLGAKVGKGSLEASLCPQLLNTKSGL
ncbi:MAG: hypothetical protein ACO3QS_07660 [Burkholderiaceae bacterium]